MSDRSFLIARRTFLAGLNVAVGGLALGFFSAEAEARSPDAKGSDPRSPAPAGDFSPNVFIHLAPDGRMTLTCQRSEMGQGIRSSLPVLIADEMGASMAHVTVLQADGDKAYGDQGTEGSRSVRTIFEEMRRVGATARIMLVAAAAKRWKVQPEACEARDHHVFHRGTGRKLGFGELALDAAREPIPAPSAVTLRPTSELTHVGKALPLIDAKAFVTGTAHYGADIRLPGMMTGVIARPPVVGGRVLRFDATRALAVPGVKRVIEMPVPKPPFAYQPLGGLAVIAENTWAAMRGRAALDVTWDPGPNGGYDSEQFREFLLASVRKPGEVARNTGDVDAALAKAARVIDAEYYVPHLPHLTMEPPVAVARFENGRCEVWAPTQDPQEALEEVARVLGIPVEKATVHVTFLGGGFGRKSPADFISEAAYLSREAGVPVRVQWTREDDLQHDYYNAVSAQRLSAGLDAEGQVTAWRHRTAFPPLMTTFGQPPTPTANDLQQGITDLPLAVPNVRAEACKAEVHARIGWVRSVYNIFHGFALGSFMDELAHARGMDPHAHLLELLGPPRHAGLKELGISKLPNYGQSLEEHPVDVGRMRAVIDRVTAVSGWADRKKHGRALGLAAHHSFLSYAAAVASVVRTPAGKLAVDELWIAFDAGTLINLDRVRSQLEGAVIFGTSLALFGGVTMKNGAVQQTNFRDERIARIHEAPRKIHVEVLRNEERPGGVGEPGVPPVAPAIANAIFALTGQRVRDLPLIASVPV